MLPIFFSQVNICVKNEHDFSNSAKLLKTYLSDDCQKSRNIHDIYIVNDNELCDHLCIIVKK